MVDEQLIKHYGKDFQKLSEESKQKARQSILNSYEKSKSEFSKLPPKIKKNIVLIAKHGYDKLSPIATAAVIEGQKSAIKTSEKYIGKENVDKMIRYYSLLSNSASKGYNVANKSIKYLSPRTKKFVKQSYHMGDRTLKYLSPKSKKAATSVSYTHLTLPTKA